MRTVTALDLVRIQVDSEEFSKEFLEADFGLERTSNNNCVKEVGRRILAEVMRFRRIPHSGDLCENEECHQCCSMHLPKIISAVKSNVPVTFVLPAFPGKSPNVDKVLGHLPDYAERLSLLFLGQLCQRVREYYAPGIKIILCSDGRVFSDLVGMRESNVTAYQCQLSGIIKELLLPDIMIFKLDDIYEDLSFSQMRNELMQSHGKSLELLKSMIRNGGHFSGTSEEKELNRLYCGITRFLFEDALYLGQTKSRSAIQRESRTLAFEVIRRSNAWSELIAKRFPEAVRLSIHPQTCGSKKLGIRLVGNESWMTPWHGVAVETESGYMLLKRSEAEALGAELIFSSKGLPSHYKLGQGQPLPFIKGRLK